MFFALQPCSSAGGVGQVPSIYYYFLLSSEKNHEAQHCRWSMQYEVLYVWCTNTECCMKRSPLPAEGIQRGK